MDGEKRLEKKEEIISHIGEQERPSLGNLAFDVIGEQEAQWLERKFEEQEVRQAVFNLESDKAPGPDGFMLAFFQRF